MTRDYYKTEMEVRQRACEVCPDKVLYSKRDVALILGLSPSTIYHNKRLFPLSRWTVADIAKVAMRI